MQEHTFNVTLPVFTETEFRAAQERGWLASFPSFDAYMNGVASSIAAHRRAGATVLVCFVTIPELDGWATTIGLDPMNLTTLQEFASQPDASTHEVTDGDNIRNMTYVAAAAAGVQENIISSGVPADLVEETCLARFDQAQHLFDTITPYIGTSARVTITTMGLSDRDPNPTRTSVAMRRGESGFCELVNGHMQRFLMLLTVALTRNGIMVLVTRDQTTSPADLPTARGWLIRDGLPSPMTPDDLKHFIDDANVICASP